jgi:hypothetical protein
MPFRCPLRFLWAFEGVTVSMPQMTLEKISCVRQPKEV